MKRLLLMMSVWSSAMLGYTVYLKNKTEHPVVATIFYAGAPSDQYLEVKPGEEGQMSYLAYCIKKISVRLEDRSRRKTVHGPALSSDTVHLGGTGCRDVYLTADQDDTGDFHVSEA